MSSSMSHAVHPPTTPPRKRRGKTISEEYPYGRRGAASIPDPAKRKAISRLGGFASHAQGVAHHWTSEEAKEAARRGGWNARKRRLADQAAQTVPTSILFVLKSGIP